MAMIDDAWLAEPPRRSRLRGALVVLLVAAVVFLGGVEVQKRYGVAGGPTAAGAFPAGAGAAGGVSRGGSPPGDDAVAQQGPGGAGASTGADEPSGETAVIGRLVSVEDGVWTVEDLGGTTHTVTVADGVRIVQESQVTTDQVAPGVTVDITGTTDDGGGISASAITLR